MFVLSILTSIKDKEVNVSAAHRGQTLSNRWRTPERAGERERERERERDRQTDRDLCLVNVVSTAAASPQIRPLVRELTCPD